MSGSEWPTSFREAVRFGAERLARAAGGAGVSVLLPPTLQRKGEIVYRRALSADVCVALCSPDARGLPFLCRGKVWPRRIRAETLAGMAPGIEFLLRSEGLGGLDIYPMAGEVAALGYVVVGLAHGSGGDSRIGTAELEAWRETEREIQLVRLGAATAGLSTLLALREAGKARGVDGLVVVDGEERVLFVQGAGRFLRAAGHEEVLGRRLQELPGGRILASAEASDGAWIRWVHRRIPGQGREEKLVEVARVVGRAGAEIPPAWRAIFVRPEGGCGAAEAAAEGAFLLELALQVSALATAAGSPEGEALARAALAVVDKEGVEEDVDLSELLRALVAETAPELHEERIRILPLLPENLPRVRGDPRALEVALRVLLRRTCADLRPGGGTITVRTWEEDGSVACCIGNDGSGAGGAVPSDEACPEGGSGRGSCQDEPPAFGLGAVRELVERAGGSFHIQSTPHLWTRHSIIFPAERCARAAGPGREPGPPPAVEVRRDSQGRLRVLVVDDNDMVRAVLRRFLERKGCEVTEARDGEVALRLLRERPFDKMLVDVNMPGLSGPELYRRLESLAPFMRQRTVFMTGDLYEPSAEDVLHSARCPAIQKPFDLGEVAGLLGL